MIRYHLAMIGPTEDGFGTFFPDLATRAPARPCGRLRANAEKALKAHLDLAEEHGEAIPDPSELDRIVAEPDVVGAARILVRAELLGRSVRVNITLPDELLTAVYRYAAHPPRFARRRFC